MTATTRTALSMFSGAGGLDIGFEMAGFSTVAAMDFDPFSIDTLRKNRPSWSPTEADAREWKPDHLKAADGLDVLIAGPPCQGFSLGGNRRATDDRNDLFAEVCRVAAHLQPRVVVIENVLNLRTMVHPKTGRPFLEEIARSLTASGYGSVDWGVFKMDGFKVPQTRRRFVFVAFREGAPLGWQLPQPAGQEVIRPWLWDLAHDEADLSNHDPAWDFASSVHTSRGLPETNGSPVQVVRFSRTASDGNPLRSWDAPFPAVDTATVWGFARGETSAKRVRKDRSDANAKYIRNPKAKVPLWRIEADNLRSLTHREYARLQTFPDDWEVVRNNKRDVHKQIGNAVPVNFAKILGENIRRAIEAQDARTCFTPAGEHQPSMF